jgi:hypothetical protein
MCMRSTYTSRAEKGRACVPALLHEGCPCMRLHVGPHILFPPSFANHRVPPGYRVLKEGMASILQKGNDVFYNEAQVTNRDLSIAILRHFLPMHEKEKAGGKYKPKYTPKNKDKKKQKDEERKKKAADGASGSQAPEADASDKAGPSSSSAAAAAAPAPKEGSKGPWILEGLAASGLRSIRYAKEVSGALNEAGAEGSCSSGSVKGKQREGWGPILHCFPPCPLR